MAGLELLSEQGYHVDRCHAGKLCQICARMGIFTQADGSAYPEQGNTKALAAIYGPHEMCGSRSKTLHDQALVNWKFSMAIFTTGKHMQQPHGDCKASEMTLHLKQTFEATILMQLYTRSQINIYIQFLQADSGNYCASMNAATLAVMWDFVCASLGGFIEDTPLADLNYVETLLPKSDQIALLEMNARLHDDHLERIMEAASKACKDVYAVLDQVVWEYFQEVTALLGK
ncbi:exosome complex component RRP41-like [Rhineura floridana]|uniref:exosome complex component RRP41-like n=1 Tax=Rhineura floridana TaxID=261503 RepID=UPI002AC7EF95|nr:exosome complex component RRP41-like [Rhineura floridana]